MSGWRKKTEGYYKLERLSWSGFNTYRKCGERYKKRYVENVKVENPNYYNTIGGKTIQHVFELFYNNEIWRLRAEVLPTLMKLLPKSYVKMISETTVDWDHEDSKLSKRELFETLPPLIVPILKLIQREKLLGKYARSEVRLQAWVDKILLHGIADFVIRRDDGHMILDGKLTRHRSKYLERDQLLWYAMLYYLQHQKLVDRMGWIYYTYGEMEWVEFNIDDVKALYREVRDTIKLIKKNKFEANPSYNTCRFCDYKDSCSAHQDMILSSRRRKAQKDQTRLEESGSPLAEDGDIVSL